MVAGGAGLWLGIDRISNERFRRPVERTGFSPSVFLSVQPGGAVDIWLTRSEMGQGVSTALPMLMAEELDADWSMVSVHQARAESTFDYGRLFTAASSSIPSLWVELRRAGALAREMLVAAASEHWGVSAKDCRTRAGYVEYGGTRLSYGELAERAAGQWVPIRPDLKSADRFELVGRSVPRLDIPDKVTGRAAYGCDVVLPGLVRAVVQRPPQKGARLLSFDARESLASHGVLDVFPIGSGIAVVAEHTADALRARSLLKARWSVGDQPDLDNEKIHLGLKNGLRGEGVAAFRQGTPVEDDQSDQPYHQAEYQVPYLAHACMEPMNCTVLLGDGRAELWLGTQAPEQTRQTAAAVAGLPLEQVAVNVLSLGGGFGRRTGQDFVTEAVEIATHLTVPVQLLWTREDDLGDAPYRDAAHIRLRAHTDDDGALKRIAQRTASAVPGPVPQDPGIGPVMGADNIPYVLDGFELRWTGVELPLPVTIWRSVGYSYNTFAMECFVDELAEKLGQDSLQFRKRLLPAGSRLLRCLESVAEMAGWNDGRKRKPGLAAYVFADTAVAMAAEVEADGSDWRVRTVWCVVDCGVVIHPDSAAAQIEGGVVQGLSAALFERILVRDGQVSSRNFDRYRMARMRDVPDIQVRFLQSGRSPGGLGEAAVPGIAPAVANALYRVTGRRFRRLPLKS